MSDPIPERRPSVVVIVIGAESLSPAVAALLPGDATIIAADSGLDHALAAGILPSVVVGDLDSISADGLKWAREHSTINEHPADKDETDTELAVRHAADLNPDRLVVISGGGDRLDHTMAVLGALASATVTSVPRIDLVWGEQHIRIVHGPSRVSIGTESRTPVSIISLVGTATGVALTGTKWELAGADLAPLSGFGVSNVAVAEQLNLSITTGVIAVFHHPLTEEQQ